PCIVALIMLDIDRSPRSRLDIDGLARRLGCPVVPLVSTRADGIDELKAAIDELQVPQAALAVDYPPAIQA
ncbi:FeoB small GTPase domain-containing protein, partial [Escherichia coli]|uniref:FeoB small GTPase domain-containing protein n=1 Tax=Escherichia coli TaxID=562 RepID=UPI0013D24950